MRYLQEEKERYEEEEGRRVQGEVNRELDKLVGNVGLKERMMKSEEEYGGRGYGSKEEMNI